ERRSLDDLVGSPQHRRWNREAESLRGLEIDDELKFARLLDRKVGRPGAFENSIDEVRHTTKERRQAGARCLVMKGDASWTRPCAEASTACTDPVALPSLCQRIAARERRGTLSRSRSSRFVLNSASWNATPVMFPPGCAKLWTNPMPTGSCAVITIGIVDVAR